MIHLIFKKSPIVLAFLLLFCNKMVGQNLVLNPGFESFITCPGFGQFSNLYISNWNKPTIASSDYYHYNCAGINPTVQAPRSGEAYAGIIAYNFGTEYREYVTGTLSAPLVAGQTYNVEFYVSLNDGYIQAITELGAYLSNAAPGPFSNVLHINVLPQIENMAGAITDTSVWKKVSGQFVAAGGEQFITIGNFHNDTTTTISQPGSSGSYGAYYFIDDVSVRLDSTTSVTADPFHKQPDIFVKNGNLLQINFPQTRDWEKQFKIYCYSTSGKLVMKKIIKDSAIQIDFGHLTSGIYFVVIENFTGNRYSQKILLTDKSE